MSTPETAIQSADSTLKRLELIARKIDKVTNGISKSLRTMNSTLAAWKDSMSELSKRIESSFDSLQQKCSIVVQISVSSRNAANEARRYSLMTAEQARLAAENAAAQKRLNESLERLKNRITSAYLPALINLTNRLTDWIAANKELIMPKLEAFIQLLGKTMMNINWERVADCVLMIAIAFVDLLEAIGPTATLIGGAFCFALIKSLPLIWTIIKEFPQISAAANGVFWAIGKIVGIFKTLGTLSLGGMTAVVRTFFSAITSIGSGVFSIIARIGNILLRLGSLSLGGIIAGAQTFFSAIISIGSGIVPVLARIGGALLSLGSMLLANPIVLIIAAVVAAIAGLAYIIYDNWEGIVAWFKGIFDRICQAFDQGLFTGLMTLFQGFSPMTWIAEGMNNLIKYLTGFDLGKIAGEMMEKFKAGFAEKFPGITAFFEESLAFLKDPFGSIGKLADSVDLQGTWDKTKEIAGTAINAVANGVSGTLDAARNIDVDQVLTDAGKALSEAGSAIGGFFSDGWKFLTGDDGTEKAHPAVDPTSTAPAAPVPPLLDALRNITLNGEIAVRFANAPAGMQTSPGYTNYPELALNPYVGYSSRALGL